MSVIKNWHAKQKRRRFYYEVQGGLLVATWVLIKINLYSKLMVRFQLVPGLVSLRKDFLSVSLEELSITSFI